MPDTNLNRGPESVSPVEAKAEMGRKLEDNSASKEVKEASIDVTSAVSIDGMEVAGEVMGNVSEAMSSSKERKGDGVKSGGAKSTVVDPEEIKKKLLQNLPTEREMKGQIEKEIKKEIKYLHKRAMKMMANPGEANYFEMANMLKKIRELRGILLTLVKASFENMKTLWLRFVHGVM